MEEKAGQEGGEEDSCQGEEAERVGECCGKPSTGLLICMRAPFTMHAQITVMYLYRNFA